MHFQAILTVGISFHKLVFTVKTSCIPLLVPLVMFLYAIPQMEETINYNVHSSTILHYFDSILYYFNAF